MAIELITGLPGNSKTLYALRMLIDRAFAENRTVYYTGLKEFLNGDERLKGTEWVEFDPLTWHETVPSGALVFIDEAQKVFRSRSLGSIPGKHVTELEEHRHKGIDFVMLTQHPSLIDPAVRKLTQVHRHMMRIFGMEASTVHRWDGQVRDNCDKPAGRRDSESVKWVFDKTLYGLYKSADVHTMKRRIPFRVKLLLAVPVVLFALGYFAYTRLHKVAAPVSDPSVVSHSAPAAGGSNLMSTSSGSAAGAGSVPLAVSDPIADAKAYVAMRTPRVDGLPETAPRYDALTVPVRVPVPAMCIQIGKVTRDGGEVKCRCYTQQATPIGVPFDMCMELAQGGRFQDFDADPRAQGTRVDDSARVVSVGRVDGRSDPRAPVGAETIASN